jgi:hypothetical protein
MILTVAGNEQWYCIFKGSRDLLKENPGAPKRVKGDIKEEAPGLVGY